MKASQIQIKIFKNRSNHKACQCACQDQNHNQISKEDFNVLRQVIQNKRMGKSEGSLAGWSIHGSLIKASTLITKQWKNLKTSKKERESGGRMGENSQISIMIQIKFSYD